MSAVRFPLAVACQIAGEAYAPMWRAIVGGLIPAQRGLRTWLVRPGDLSAYTRKRAPRRKRAPK